MFASPPLQSAVQCPLYSLPSIYISSSLAPDVSPTLGVLLTSFAKLRKRRVGLTSGARLHIKYEMRGSLVANSDLQGRRPKRLVGPQSTCPCHTVVGKVDNEISERCGFSFLGDLLHDFLQCISKKCSVDNKTSQY